MNDFTRKIENQDYKDYQLHVDMRVAKLYGLAEAAVINKFQSLIDSNKAAGRNYYQGRTWTYNSYEEWVGEDYFICFSKEQMRRLLESLIEAGILIKANYNKRRNDKTNWYAFAEEDKWIRTKSPIPNYGIWDENALPKSADQKELPLFDDKNALPKSAETFVNENHSVEIGSETVESSKPFCRNRQNDLSETANHYQEEPISSKEVAEEEKEPVSTFELLFNKTAIKAYIDGTCDKLAFDFNNIDLVNKNIERLFRMFAGVDNPNPIHVDQIRNELLNDSRMELSYKVCWVIIQLAFMEYPGAEKKYQNVNSLLRKIGWKKDDFAKDLPTYRKQQETFLARQKQKEVEQKSKEQELTQMLEWTKAKLAEHHNILTAAEVNEINKFLKANKIMDANGTLQHYLYDVHKLNEAAA